MNKLSIIIPCFNEEKNIDPLVDSWSKALKTAERYELFITFIDNGSSDSTNNKATVNNEYYLDNIFNFEPILSRTQTLRVENYNSFGSPEEIV